VAQSVYKLASDQKRALLTHIVTSRNLWQVLCFVRTKHGASRLARQLEKDGLKTTAIHGDKSQAARLEALDDFKAAKVQVMVATDVAARGLDIDDLPLVVNYEMPYVPEDYIHRIGRTGRAGAAGQAISLCAPDEEKLLSEIERMLKRTIPVATPEGFTAHRDAQSSPRPSAQRQPREVRETRGSKRPRHATAHASHADTPARRERAADADDRNPDQAPVSRALNRTGAASAPVLTGTVGRPSLRRKHPIPALLMKRSVREPEKV
jgi:ATP-dependent RNA helicase RhlE